MASFAVFLPLFGLYLFTLSPTVPLEDGGEMVRAAACLGVTHPPGLPLYVMAARLFLMLPAGDPAFRLNLLSALSGAAACALLVRASFRMLGAAGFTVTAALAGSAVAGFLLATGQVTWWQSVIAEKYAFGLLLAAATAAALAGAGTSGGPSGGKLAVLGLAWGLWAGHHGQAVYFLPAVALVVWRTAAAGGRPGRDAACFVLLFAAGLSARLIFPPLRAAAHPLHNWNSPDTWARFLDYSLGRPYFWRTLYYGPAETAGRAISNFRFFVHQFGWVGCVLGVAGAASLALRERWRAFPWLLAALTGLWVCGADFRGGAASETYHLPVFLVFGLSAAFGAAVAVDRLRSLGRPVAAAAAAAFLVWGTARVARTWGEAGRERHFFPYDFGVNVMASVEPDSILIAHSDRDLFPLWYLHDVLGKGQGVALVDANYLTPPLAAGKDAGRVQLLWPEGERALAARFPFLDILARVDPGRPVRFSAVFKGQEGYVLVPSGFAYSLARGREGHDPGGIERERLRFIRRGRFRGVFSPAALVDCNTQEMLAGYVQLEYRRAHLLSAAGNYGEAIRLFRTALGWPPFRGVDRAGIKGSLGWCLERAGDDRGALLEYQSAVRLDPARPALLKLLGMLCLRLGRTEEAVGALGQALLLSPTDRELRELVERAAPGRGMPLPSGRR